METVSKKARQLAKTENGDAARYLRGYKITHYLWKNIILVNFYPAFLLKLK